MLVQGLLQTHFVQLLHFPFQSVAYVFVNQKQFFESVFPDGIPRQLGRHGDVEEFGASIQDAGVVVDDRLVLELLGVVDLVEQTVANADSALHYEQQLEHFVVLLLDHFVYLVDSRF